MNSLARITKKVTKVVAAVVVSAALALTPVIPAIAAVNWPAPTAKISFTFDDGGRSVYSLAKPVFDKYGLKGTAYITTGCVGMTTVPNTCRADQDIAYMTWTQIKALYAQGWDISSHSVTHPYLATSDATDGQPNVLTPAQVEQELAGSKAALAAQGINAPGFASPYGDYNNAVLANIARHYEYQRGFQDIDNNVWSYNDYIINDMPVQKGVTVAQVKARIDQTIANNQWLVLTFHDIKLFGGDDYDYTVSELDQILAYAKQKVTANQIKAVTVKDSIVKSDINLLANGGFVNGMANWTTNAPANIKADNANNGSFPNPTNAVSITSGATNQSLFSQMVNVDSTQSYMIKSFMHLKAITAGELGWYIDEYDAAGNWISGKWVTARYRAAVQNVNFAYKPSSSAVKKASLQIYTTANSGIQAYMDNFQFFPLSATTTPPPAEPTNLVAGGTFDAGLGTWTTNSATITHDATGQGSPANPVNSVKMVASAQERHLFSPQVAVSSTNSYTLATWVNMSARTSGHIAFYIDEYDAAGNWISGQYKSELAALGAIDRSIAYTPSSASVAKANLQVIITANSGITAYVDNVRWYQN